MQNIHAHTWDQSLHFQPQTIREADLARGHPLDLTVDYAKTRKQFGTPIGRFQALQHRMVDVFIEYEQAKSMVYMASMTQGSAKSEAELAKAAAALKVQLGKSGRVVGQQAIQLHGGMGTKHSA